MTSNLTTLANVKAWLGITGTEDDVMLARLLAAQSRFIQSWLNRYIASQTYTEVRDGSGAGKGRLNLMFNNYPVTAVQSVTVQNIPVPLSPDGAVSQPGYGFDTTQLWVAPVSYIAPSYEFSKGNRNIVLKYTAGFLVLPPDALLDSDPALLPAEARIIPATPFQLQPYLTWISDNGVWDSMGVALIKVDSMPATGQYSVDATGLYTFAAADVGNVVSISYSYVPEDIEQACIEMVSLRYKDRDRIGIVSKSVGTENITFMQKDMPSDVATMLNQYRKVYAF